MNQLYWYEVTLLVGAKQSRGSIDVLADGIESAKEAATTHYLPVRSQVKQVRYMGLVSDYKKMMIECQRINTFIEQLELL